MNAEMRRIEELVLDLGADLFMKTTIAAHYESVSTWENEGGAPDVSVDEMEQRRAEHQCRKAGHVFSAQSGCCLVCNKVQCEMIIAQDETGERAAECDSEAVGFCFKMELAMCSDCHRQSGCTCNFKEESC